MFKLFKRYCKMETDTYLTGVFLSFGQCYREDSFGNTIDDGSFVRIELPFAVSKKIMNPRSFTQMRCKCRPVWLFRNRVAGYEPKSIKMRLFAWVPVSD